MSIKKLIHETRDLMGLLYFQESTSDPSGSEEAEQASEAANQKHPQLMGKIRSHYRASRLHKDAAVRHKDIASAADQFMRVIGQEDHKTVQAIRDKHLAKSDYHHKKAAQHDAIATHASNTGDNT